MKYIIWLLIFCWSSFDLPIVTADSTAIVLKNFRKIKSISMDSKYYQASSEMFGMVQENYKVIQNFLSPYAVSKAKFCTYDNY